MPKYKRIMIKTKDAKNHALQVLVKYMDVN
jgi:hypothetical protein